eukprot:jgi/Picsp_1/2188/NSC_05652-R1_hypothetical protein CHLNCDRAFT_143561 [Chlorella variabilis]
MQATGTPGVSAWSRLSKQGGFDLQHVSLEEAQELQKRVKELEGQLEESEKLYAAIYDEWERATVHYDKVEQEIRAAQAEYMEEKELHTRAFQELEDSLEKEKEARQKLSGEKSNLEVELKRVGNELEQKKEALTGAQATVKSLEKRLEELDADMKVRSAAALEKEHSASRALSEAEATLAMVTRREAVLVERETAMLGEQQAQRERYEKSIGALREKESALDMKQKALSALEKSIELKQKQADGALDSIVARIEQRPSVAIGDDELEALYRPQESMILAAEQKTMKQTKQQVDIASGMPKSIEKAKGVTKRKRAAAIKKVSPSAQKIQRANSQTSARKQIPVKKTREEEVASPVKATAKRKRISKKEDTAKPAKEAEPKKQRAEKARKTDTPKKATPRKPLLSITKKSIKGRSSNAKLTTQIKKANSTKAPVAVPAVEMDEIPAIAKEGKAGKSRQAFGAKKVQGPQKQTIKEKKQKTAPKPSKSPAIALSSLPSSSPAQDTLTIKTTSKKKPSGPISKSKNPKIKSKDSKDTVSVVATPSVPISSVPIVTRSGRVSKRKVLDD